MNVKKIVLALLASLVVQTGDVRAHAPSESFLTVDTSREESSIRWDAAIKDLEPSIGFDGDGNGIVTWGEVMQRKNSLFSYLKSRVSIRRGDSICGMREPSLQVDSKIGRGAYVVMTSTLECEQEGPGVAVYSDAIFEIDGGHRTLVTIRSSEGTSPGVLTDGSRSFELDRTGGSMSGTALMFVRHGIEHLLIGYDHIAFLLALLVSIPVRAAFPSGSRLRTVHGAVRSILGIVTSFTVAHSITLAAATTGAMEISPSIVEPCIALSVALAALNNVRPLVIDREWAFAFLAGLIHGFGFASVLGEQGLAAGSLAVPLIGFNVGVELGQLMVVLLSLPLLYAAQRYARIGYATSKMVSVGAFALGMYWFVERIV